MDKEQMWEEMKQFLIENRDHARKFGGHLNNQLTTLDRVLEKMQEIDPEITNEEIYYEGTEFYPSNKNMKANN